MKFSFTLTLFDKLKTGLYEEALCFFSSDSFDDDASPREFYNEIQDIGDALDSIKSDFRKILTKYSK